MKTFSDLEQNIEFQSDLNFGKDHFCVVKFILDEKNRIKYYVSQILEVDGDSFKINFMRRTVGVNAFIFLEKPDIT